MSRLPPSPTHRLVLHRQLLTSVKISAGTMTGRPPVTAMVVVMVVMGVMGVMLVIVVRVVGVIRVVRVVRVVIVVIVVSSK